MKQLIIKTKVNAYDYDVNRMVAVCKSVGYNISPETAKEAWENFSDSYCAGWLMLPESDDELISDILSQCDILEEQ